MVPEDQPTGFVFNDDYHAPVALKEPMLDDEANALSCADPMAGVNISGAIVADASATGAMALSVWNLGSKQSAPPPIAVSAEIAALQAILLNLSIPVPPRMNYVSQLLALAAQHTPGVSNQGGAGSSSGE